MADEKYRSLSGGTRSVTATEAVRTFGRLVDTVRESRTEYIVERGGVGVVRISPYLDRPFVGRDLVALMQQLPEGADGLAQEIETGRARTNTPQVPDNPWAS